MLVLKRIGLVGLLFVFAWSANTIAVEVGEPAPQFGALTIGGERAISLAEYAGKVVILDFWASWCGPCLVAMPELERLSNALEPESVVLLAVSVDSDPKRAARFMRKMGVSYDSLIDSDGKIAAQYDLPGMPTTYVINPEGLIVARHVGFKPGDEAKLASAVNDVLAK